MTLIAWYQSYFSNYKVIITVAMSEKLHDCLRDLNEEAEMQRLLLWRINTSKAIYLSPSYSADDDERGEGGGVQAAKATCYAKGRPRRQAVVVGARGGGCPWCWFSLPADPSNRIWGAMHNMYVCVCIMTTSAAIGIRICHFHSKTDHSTNQGLAL